MTASRRPPDLLIIDDDETVRRLLEMQARQNGFRPELHEDGEDAMGRVKELAEELDVVLLDLRMPGWSGLRCLEHLREHHPSVPTVVLSGADE
ncbi:MAG: response regulator, partial [Akkermansiaceae bacterium]|nr:response regulator [Akkermansiaceae bacterium]